MIATIARRARGLHDRTMTRLEVSLEHLRLRPPAYHPIAWDALVQGVEACLGMRLDGLLAEPALAEIEHDVRSGMRNLAPIAPFPVVHHGDFGLARLCYGICRAIQPEVFVETGVAYGVTSAFMLKAMQANGKGVLHSVDRAPLGYPGDSYIGFLIPDVLRSRWHLHRGSSSSVLPRLLAELKQVDGFLHDSRHTYRVMRWELGAVMPYLARTSLVMADDVDRNVAFEDWVTEHRPAFSATMREGDKSSLLGVGVFGEPGTPLR